MVCDFFHPSVGGVEKHVYALSQSLIRLGHKVVVLTHQYGDLRGVRMLPGGVKVYYAPIHAHFARCVMPTGGLLLLPALRRVVLHERITIVHTHALCTMAMESIALGSLLGCRVVHTQHSNFELTGVISRLQAAMESAVFAQAHGLIAVSRAARDNMCARCGVPAAAVCVIPNAVDACSFVPAPENIWPRQMPDGRPCINVVFLARLVRCKPPLPHAPAATSGTRVPSGANSAPPRLCSTWRRPALSPVRRKGISLLATVIPRVCALCPDVYFIIGGDGPRRWELEAMIERHELQSRVELLGLVRPPDVPAALTRGQIFLSTSLTEAFCIAVLEAVSCGLLAVSTRVGGVAEILPPHMMQLTEPESAALVRGLVSAVNQVRAGGSRCYHDHVAHNHSWAAVATATAEAYDAIAAGTVLRAPLASLLWKPFAAARHGGILGALAAGLGGLLIALQAALLALLSVIAPLPASPDLSARRSCCTEDVDAGTDVAAAWGCQNIAVYSGKTIRVSDAIARESLRLRGGAPAEWLYPRELRGQSVD